MPAARGGDRVAAVLGPAAGVGGVAVEARVDPVVGRRGHDVSPSGWRGRTRTRTRIAAARRRRPSRRAGDLLGGGEQQLDPHGRAVAHRAPGDLHHHDERGLVVGAEDRLVGVLEPALAGRSPPRQSLLGQGRPHGGRRPTRRVERHVVSRCAQKTGSYRAPAGPCTHASRLPALRSVSAPLPSFVPRARARSRSAATDVGHGALAAGDALDLANRKRLSVEHDARASYRSWRGRRRAARAGIAANPAGGQASAWPGRPSDELTSTRRSAVVGPAGAPLVGSDLRAGRASSDRDRAPRPRTRGTAAAGAAAAT